jgi:predicted nucleotidyltransferase
MQEEKSIPLVRILEARESTLAEISDAIRKYYHLAPEKFELSPSIIKGLRVSLVRRFFTEDLNYIGIAKEFVKLTDFYKLIDKMIYQPTSQGKLGGKSSGVFIASNILEKRAEDLEILRNIKIPKTWFVASDCVLSFMRYNNLEEVLEQKYKELNELRLEYPLLVQLFKNSEFPPEIEKGLAAALDDFGDTPLIVRSSSLLEDQMGASFSGKYKSLFLANQGSKEDRLDALKDAVAEVSASTFAPDPIEYRAERGLLDFHEEMGVMIQEVVGNKIGKYYFPSYAGVAFSNNEFRWSTRIKREDGLVRIVPGLGTRAVDRVGDDYPILLAPGQPDLSVNMTIEDSLKYSPKRMDVINLESNEFETISIDKMVKEYAENYPGLKQIISIVDQHRVRQPNVMDDIASCDYVVTFDGLVKNTRFVKKMNEILKTLQDSLRTPVDIEFASDGKDFYILQCRPQSKGSDLAPDNIPTNIPEDKIIFSANKHISNGKVPEITHIVYVDPVKYGEIPDIESMKKVGRAVGKLNSLLPRKKFILMGPGRWGSRGDIKLGVNVTYSDISNSAVLLEIARKKGNYVPDLSFGTHFFQDLVEASIRYIPLYPDDKGIKFNEEFLTSSKNIFEELIPDYKKLAEVIKVIDVPNSTKGKILKIMVNADNNEALAFISEPGADLVITDHIADNKSDHWKWRLTMVENMASRIDGDKFGIKEMYVFGSTYEGTAGPGSDIDLVFHVDQNEFKKDEFSWWVAGWSDALSEMNYIRTGYKSNGLLDVHYVNDEDIKKKNSYSIYIKSGAYKSKKLKMMTEFK